MNETTQVIIATLSGFIIAFFAEPVKTYFQNKAKLSNLRVALYKEIIHNYSNLRNCTEGDISLNPPDIAQHLIRTECYKNALQNEVSLFYQLDEANRINLLQGTIIGKIIAMSNEVKSSNDLLYTEFVDLCKTFNEVLDSIVYRGKFDSKILISEASLELYREMMKRGNENFAKEDTASEPPKN